MFKHEGQTLKTG